MTHPTYLPAPHACEIRIKACFYHIYISCFLSLMSSQLIFFFLLFASHLCFKDTLQNRACMFRLSREVRARNPVASGTPLFPTNKRIQFRLCVLAYHCVHGTAPTYLADNLQLTADAPARRRLRSTDSMMLQDSSTRRSTLGDRTLSVRQRLEPGTVCHHRQEPSIHGCTFGEKAKRISSDCRFRVTGSRLGVS